MTLHLAGTYHPVHAIQQQMAVDLKVVGTPIEHVRELDFWRRSADFVDHAPPDLGLSISQHPVMARLFLLSFVAVYCRWYRWRSVPQMSRLAGSVVGHPVDNLRIALPPIPVSSVSDLTRETLRERGCHAPSLATHGGRPFAWPPPACSTQASTRSIAQHARTSLNPYCATRSTSTPRRTFHAMHPKNVGNDEPFKAGSETSRDRCVA